MSSKHLWSRNSPFTTARIVTMRWGRQILLMLMLLFVSTSIAQDGGNRNGNGANAKDTSTWNSEEYSGLRGKKEVQTAMASKGFTWITGSPADNEKLSIGKNAQFFGFVALRYQSGRAANRGTLGRAMFSISSGDQREAMAKAVQDEVVPLREWWAVREKILTLLEDHLYTGTTIDGEKLEALGEKFSLLNSEVAIREARAYAAFEDIMSSDQENLIATWRSDPELAREQGRDARVEDQRIDRNDWKLLEDLYAKCFSWISGRPQDNEIIPIGQPAQFFGFVSIRHKSGHGANRGNIARDFYALLNAKQRAYIGDAVEKQLPLVRQFLEARHLYLNQLARIRSDASDFNREEAGKLARAMGRLEMAVAKIEAETYRNIRSTMSDEQLQLAMHMRANYVIDESQVATMNLEERGAALSVLCSGCHGSPDAWRVGMVGPSLDGFWDRPIASEENFEFSDALKAAAENNGSRWTSELLDEFLANPKLFAPGTKMEFQGFLNPDDRRAIIELLEASR